VFIVRPTFAAVSVALTKCIRERDGRRPGRLEVGLLEEQVCSLRASGEHANPVKLFQNSRVSQFLRLLTHLPPADPVEFATRRVISPGRQRVNAPVSHRMDPDSFSSFGSRLSGPATRRQRCQCQFARSQRGPRRLIEKSCHPKGGGFHSDREFDVAIAGCGTLDRHPRSWWMRSGDRASWPRWTGSRARCAAASQ
jgi:hypothetical protein